MHIDAAGSDNLAFASDHFGSGSYNYGDVRLHVGITSFPYCTNMAVLDGDICLHDSPVIENQGVRDDRIHCALAARTLRLTHAVANDLSSSELHLLTVGRVVLLYLDDDVGIREAHFVADGWAKHLRIRSSVHCVRHFRLPRAPLRQCSHHSLVETIHLACACVGDEGHVAGLTRLEAHGCSRWNVQAIPKCCVSIKRE